MFQDPPPLSLAHLVSSRSSGVCVSGSAATPLSSLSVLLATYRAFPSFPPYDSAEAQAAMRACMRYCVCSMTESTEALGAGPAGGGPGRTPRGCRRSSRLTARPPFRASSDLTSGASCAASPTSISRWPRRAGIHAAGSVACAASSTTTRSKSAHCPTICSPAPAHVASTTCVSRRICSSAFRTVRRIALLQRLSARSARRNASWSCGIVRISAFSCIRSDPKSSSFWPVSCSTWASREYLCATVSILAGLPMRTTRSFAAANFSTMLSTAVLLIAAARTRFPLATVFATTSVMTRVLPVPGGPCDRERSAAGFKQTAGEERCAGGRGAKSILCERHSSWPLRARLHADDGVIAREPGRDRELLRGVVRDRSGGAVRNLPAAGVIPKRLRHVWAGAAVRSLYCRSRLSVS